MPQRRRLSRQAKKRDRVWESYAIPRREWRHSKRFPTVRAIRRAIGRPLPVPDRVMLCYCGEPHPHGPIRAGPRGRPVSERFPVMS